MVVTGQMETNIVQGLRLSVASTAVCVCVCTVSKPVCGLCDNNGGYTEANWTCMAI